MFPPCCNAEIRFDKPAEAGSRQPIPEELAGASVRALSEVSVSRGQRASVERHSSPISPGPYQPGMASPRSCKAKAARRRVQAPVAQEYLSGSEIVPCGERASIRRNDTPHRNSLR